MIVTTIQKMQILVSKRLQEGTPEYNKIKNLKIAFVVDECHRAVTPKTKRELERFLANLYGMDLPAHRDLLKILIHRWEICRELPKNYMVNVFTVIQYRMRFMTKLS